MDKLTSHNRGFSTIEIMIAIVVVLTTLTASTMLSLGNSSVLTDTEINSEALSKAQELIEEAQSDAREDFQFLVPKAPVTDDIYTKTLSVSTTNLFTKLVTGTVTWAGDHNRLQKVSISSIVTDFENATGGNTCDSIPSGNWANPITKNLTTDFGTLVGDSSGKYPITNVDVFKNKLYVGVKGTRESSAETIPRTATGDTGPGSVEWNNPVNITTLDANYADVTPIGSNDSKYLKATNFGFNIPKGATILGIEVKVERSANANSAISDKEVRVIKADGALSTENKAITNTKWSTSHVVKTYGDSSDLWGESWSATDINNSNFGIIFSVGSSVANKNARVHNVAIVVTYIRQLYVLSVTDPGNPTLAGEIKNGVPAKLPEVGFNAIASNGTYAYAAMNSGSTNGQLAILDTSGTSYTIKSLYKTPGATGFGNSIFYRNGYVYLGLKTASGPEFHIIDVHNPENPSEIGTFTIGNDINNIQVKGKYAYIATPNNQELITLDISNPRSPTRVGGFDAPGNSGNGKNVYVFGNILYFGRTYSTNELYVLDNKNPATILSPLAFKNLNTSVNDMLVRNNLLYLVTGTQGTAPQLQIFNVENISNISSYAPPVALSASGNAIDPSLDCEGNNLYVSSNDSSGKGSVFIITAEP